MYFPSTGGGPGYVLVSDIPNNRIMKFDEKDGSFTVFRQPANYANGNTRDRQGRLVTCEHSVVRRVTRTEPDGRITVLADNFEGKRLNAPNDIVAHSDGSIWFTDPGYGSLLNYEGYKSVMAVTSNTIPGSVSWVNQTSMMMVRGAQPALSTDTD